MNRTTALRLGNARGDNTQSSNGAARRRGDSAAEQCSLMPTKPHGRGGSPHRSVDVPSQSTGIGCARPALADGKGLSNRSGGRRQGVHGRGGVRVARSGKGAVARGTAAPRARARAQSKQKKHRVSQTKGRGQGKRASESRGRGERVDDGEHAAARQTTEGFRATGQRVQEGREEARAVAHAWRGQGGIGGGSGGERIGGGETRKSRGESDAE